MAGVDDGPDDIVALQKANADDTAGAGGGSPVVAQIVAQDVITRIVEDVIVFYKVDLEAAKLGKTFEMARVAGADAAQWVVLYLRERISRVSGLKSQIVVVDGSRLAGAKERPAAMMSLLEPLQG